MYIYIEREREYTHIIDRCRLAVVLLKATSSRGPQRLPGRGDHRGGGPKRHAGQAPRGEGPRRGPDEAGPHRFDDDYCYYYQSIVIIILLLLLYYYYY